MKSRELPSYCRPGRPLTPKGVVIHHFSAKYADPENRYDPEVCRRLMMDLNRPIPDREWYLKDRGSRYYASAHLFVTRAGDLIKLIPFDQEAWHAGESLLAGRDNLNKWTLGIELIGSEDDPFTDEQYGSLSGFLGDFLDEWGIPLSHVAGHDTVRWEAIQAGARATPKTDPSGSPDGSGTNFDWQRLYNGIAEHRAIMAEASADIGPIPF